MNTASKKESGSYYTPPTLADFITYHLFGTGSGYKFSKSINALEPSAGDGIFLDSLFNNVLFNDRLEKLPRRLNVTAVEYDSAAYETLQGNAGGYRSGGNKIDFIHDDFLNYYSDTTKKFDLVIGNPPYIKRGFLADEQIKSCETIHKSVGLSDKKMKNIWTGFLIGGAEMLNDTGVICYVLPVELLQVNYAKEIRDYLREKFRKIEIFTFNELIFPSIEQDVIVLFCAKTGEPGVSFYHVDRLTDLENPSYVRDHSNVHRQTLNKWTNYILSDDELGFLDDLRSKLSIKPMKEYCRAEVGVVTAANDFFIVSEDVVESRGLRSVARPMLQKGMHTTAGLCFTDSDRQRIIDSGKSAHFLAFEDKPKDDFSADIRNYLDEGEGRELDQRYKMKLRKRWYIVPSLWMADGFFTKRSNIFPRVLINDAETLVTDSFYRIKMSDGYRIQNLAFSFYNSLTLIFAELEGRYYGGSVLELMPNECKNLPLPYCVKVTAKDVKKLDNLLRNKTTLSSILSFTDDIVLKKAYGLNDKQLSRLSDIYRKLIKRRLKDHTYTY